MDLRRFRLVLLSLFGVSIGGMFKSCSLEIAFHSKTITSNMTWEHKGVWDKLACAVACMNHPHCLTFSYDPSKKKCMGYPRSLDSYMDDVMDVQDGGSIVVRTCRGNIGQKCIRNDECSVQGSVCFAGVCLCQPGLYYSPQQNSCLSGCVEYGDDMDIYKGAGITKHNDKWQSFPTLTACCKKCAKEKSFVCLTAEYEKKTQLCYLSSSGYQDVIESERNLGADGWVMGQRRCK